MSQVTAEKVEAGEPKVYRQQDARVLLARIEAFRLAVKRLKKEEAELKAERECVRDGILAGLLVPQKGRLLVLVEKVTGSRRPAWKEEAGVLAVRLGLDEKKYIEGVIDATPAPVTDELSIKADPHYVG